MATKNAKKSSAKKSSAKKSSAKKSSAKKSSAKKSSAKKSSGLGPIYSKLSKLERDVKNAGGVSEAQFNSLKGRVGKIEAHSKGQDRALMALAEGQDAQGAQIGELQRSRDEILRRLGDAGDGGGFRRFKVV